MKADNSFNIRIDVIQKNMADGGTYFGKDYGHDCLYYRNLIYSFLTGGKRIEGIRMRWKRRSKKQLYFGRILSIMNAGAEV